MVARFDSFVAANSKTKREEIDSGNEEKQDNNLAIIRVAEIWPSSMKMCSSVQGERSETQLKQFERK